jgi:hypothetical protein
MILKKTENSVEWDDADNSIGRLRKGKQEINYRWPTVQAEILSHERDNSGNYNKFPLMLES